MKVKEAMHKGVKWCDPDTPVSEIARMMREQDVGAVPIGENDRLIGMVTDRDIVCRSCTEGRDPDMVSSGIDRRALPVSAALQPGPQPNRDGIRQAQGPDPQSRRKNL